MTRDRLVKAACVWLIACASVVMAQEPSAPAPQAQDAPGMVTLNFPENIELKALVDYVGKRLNINFVYDEQIAGRRITIKTPMTIPVDSLMTLLQSALKMKGLVILPMEVPGMMRVEISKSLTAESVGVNLDPDALKNIGPATAITRAFPLQHATAQRIGEVVTPFLTGPTASVTTLPEFKLVIVTDYLQNMARIEQIVAMIDRPGNQIRVQFIPVANLSADTLAQKVQQLLQTKSTARGGTTQPGGVAVVGDERTNQVAVVGSLEEAQEAIDLIRSLDVPLGTETKIYSFSVASASHIDDLTKKIIGDLAAKRLYKSATDRSANILIATTTPEIHKQIADLKAALDRPAADAQSPIRFYKLENAKAKDVIETLRNIEGEEGFSGLSVDGMTSGAVPSPASAEAGESQLNIRGPSAEEINRGASGLLNGFDSAGGEAGGAGRKRGGSVTLRDARVMADEPSNTLIVVASPTVHQIYEKLIKRLDVRRPQVLIEATVVAVDTTDDFKLGVEIIDTGAVNGGRYLTFSSFGLAETDTATGQVSFDPSLGFNGALLSTDVADVVIKALESDKRTRVVSRPSVLVNDNAKGSLESESEEPYSSVNASDTVATTTLGGFVSAGTTIKVTPQISEGDHLKLEYEVTLSSFTNEGTADLPPSRQKNSIASEATIPNGYTIVVGGLSGDRISETVDRIPFLGSIPGLEYLFSNRVENKRQTTLFVFIRAVILRDDKFADLKQISGDAAQTVELPGDFPESEPVVIQ
jgi:general secretion pathway protein D